MAHYAFLDQDNRVVQVIVGVDENVIQTDLDGAQVGGSSEAWEAFYESRPWFSGLACKRTSYNSTIRKHYASIGYTYRTDLDAFVPPKCHDEADLDESTCLWACANEAHNTFVEE